MGTADRPDDVVSGVDGVLITAELARRPSRPPDHAAESRALAALAREMAADPGAVLQRLVELVLDLCRAGSAGLSVLEPGGADDPVFRWRAVAGAFAPHLGGTMPRDASPCGVVIDRDEVLLFDRPGRFFRALRGVEPPVREALLAPWHADGGPVGTLWAVAHDPDRRFDAEDARLLAGLAGFAAAAHRTAGLLAGLRESEERYRCLAGATREGVAIHDLRGILEANDAFCRLFGYARAEVLGRRPVDFVAPGARTEAVASGDGHREEPYESRGLRKDGSTFPVEFCGREVVYRGHPARVGLVRDLTAAKAAEAAVREGEERLRLAVEATGLGVWDVDVATGARRWSAEYKAILGLPPEAEPSTGLFTSLIHPDDRDRVVARYRAVFATGGDGRYEVEYRVLRASDGAERWVRAAGRVLFGPGGPARGVGTLVDVTERRQAEAALRAGEARYRALVETSPEAIYVHRDGVVVLANRQAATLLGAERPEDLVGRRVLEELVDPASLPLARARTARLAEPCARNEPVVLTYRRLDGTPVQVEAGSAAVEIDGRLAVQVVLRDVTGRERAAAEARRQARLLELSREAILAWELGGAIVYWNTGAEELYGYPRGEAVGRVSHQLLRTVHPTDPPRSCPRWRRPGTGSASWSTPPGTAARWWSRAGRRCCASPTGACWCWRPTATSPRASGPRSGCARSWRPRRRRSSPSTSAGW